MLTYWKALSHHSFLYSCFGLSSAMLPFSYSAYLAQNLKNNIMAKGKSPSKSSDKKAPTKNLKEKRAEKQVKKTAKKSSSSL